MIVPAPTKPPPRPAVIRVLGIDPGVVKHGIALLEVTRDNRVTVLAHGHVDGNPVSLLDTYAPALIAVEEPATVHRLESTPVIVDTAVSAGRFWGAAEARGVPVATMAPARWRALVCGRAAVGDAEVARALRIRVPSWPKVSNSHGRDAAGVALACAMTWPACLRVAPGV